MKIHYEYDFLLSLAEHKGFENSSDEQPSRATLEQFLAAQKAAKKSKSRPQRNRAASDAKYRAKLKQRDLLKEQLISQLSIEPQTREQLLENTGMPAVELDRLLPLVSVQENDGTYIVAT